MSNAPKTSKVPNKSKKRTHAALWKGFLWGGVLSMTLYLLGLMLLALLLVKGTLTEEFPGIAVLCTAAALCGGLLTIRRTGWGAGGLLTGVLFALLLILVGLLCWDTMAWFGHGGILLLCAAGGGFLASLINLAKTARKRQSTRMRK